MRRHCERNVKMKQRKIVSLIGALVLIIGAVVLITGCPQATSGKFNIIEFDAASIKCKKTNSSTYTDINNGGLIQENDQLKKVGL